MNAYDVELRRVADIRFRGGFAAPTQRDLVAASLLLCPDAKGVGARGTS